MSLKITFRLNTTKKKNKIILTDSMFSVLSQGKSVIYNILDLFVVFSIRGELEPNGTY